MSKQSAFLPQRQFHILINDANEEQNLTVLPGTSGNFRVIKHGQVLGEVNCTPQKKIVCYKGRLKKALMDQLEKHINNHYSLSF